MRKFHVFKHQFSASGTVEGKDYCAEFSEGAEAAGYAGRHLAAVDGFATERAGDCTIRRDEGRIRLEAEVFKERDGVVGAASGGDGNGDPRCLRGFEGHGGARSEGLREGGQQGSVHVDGYQAHGRMHRLSVTGRGQGTGNREQGTGFKWLHKGLRYLAERVA